MKEVLGSWVPSVSFVVFISASRLTFSSPSRYAPQGPGFAGRDGVGGEG